MLPPPQPGEPYPDPGASFAAGLGYMVLSPLIVASGLIEGLATLPYFLNADLHATNQAMVDSGAAVSLDQTYRSAYGTPLAEVPASGSTGKVFRDMSEASAHFTKVLRGYGVADAERYVLTAVRTADRQGYTLYAVVYRPGPVIEVSAGGQVRRLDARQRAWWRPYEHDARGRPLERVIDWAGVARTAIRTQKGQAILMTLAANSVLINRRTDDYRAAERRWVAGGFREVVAERKAYLDRRMGPGS